MKPDIVLTWPTGNDFPIWRSMLRLHRDLFGEVIIVMSKSSGKHDFTSFLKTAFEPDRVTLIEHNNYIVLSDWRNAAVNAALSRSSAEWVWFTEQDFMVADMASWMAKIARLAAGSDVITYKQGDRKHPASAFVKREWIDKTKKDFGIVPGISDHFSMFFAQLEAAGAKEVDLTADDGKDFYHMNGLTHNYSLVESGNVENVYQQGLFQLYNTYARMQNVLQDPRFIDITFEADRLLTPITRFFAPKK